MTDESNEVLASGKVINSQVTGKVYGNLFQPAFDLVGMTLGNVVGVLDPVSEKIKSRVSDWVREIGEKVPEERQAVPLPQIAIPSLRHMVLLTDDSPLLGMFKRLLTAAIDRSKQSVAHPAFVKILEQLSPEEALLIAVFDKHDTITVHHTLEKNAVGIRTGVERLDDLNEVFVNLSVTEPQGIGETGSVLLICVRLEAIGLVERCYSEADMRFDFNLTSFGVRFATLCIANESENKRD